MIINSVNLIYFEYKGNADGTRTFEDGSLWEDNPIASYPNLKPFYDDLARPVGYTFWSNNLADMTYDTDGSFYMIPVCQSTEQIYPTMDRTGLDRYN